MPKYLIKHGIDASRLRVKGQNISIENNENEVPDTEIPHQRNRRTMFRVIGKLDGTRYDCENEVLDADETPLHRLKKIEKCTNCPF